MFKPEKQHSSPTGVDTRNQGILFQKSNLKQWKENKLGQTVTHINLYVNVEQHTTSTREEHTKNT